MTVTTQLAAELRQAMAREAFIYAGSTDPANDLIPVPRYLVETSAEMLEILQQQVRTLRALTLHLNAGFNFDQYLKAVPIAHSDLVRLDLVRLRQALAEIGTMSVIT